MRADAGLSRAIREGPRVGKEATCGATLAGRRSTTKAHLDSVSLRLRGELRGDFPLARLSGVRASDGTLFCGTPAGALELDLGKSAAAWAQAIRQPKSLLDKLGVANGQRVCVRGIADAEFLAELTERLGTAPARACRATYDTIFAGFETARDLAALPDLRRHLAPAGALWLIAPKGKGSPVPERELRAALLAADLVDVKVASFSATHTAVKAVIPVGLRGTLT
jgi:hypothetical protein